MANGIAIKDVDNKLQSLEGEEVIPISTGANEPEVVDVDTLKEYINADIEDTSGKENTSNKVTSLSASSTDTQYPSAKCVWDLVGDIETILASI